MPIIQCPIQRFVTEFKAEFKPTRRWKSWAPIVDAASVEYERLKSAFDDQSQELNIALDVMTPEERDEFRHRAYPELYPR